MLKSFLTWSTLWHEKLDLIKARIDATITLFAAGGLNLPYLCIKRILGEDMPKIDIRYGTHLKRRYEEAFTDAHGALIEW